MSAFLLAAFTFLSSIDPVGNYLAHAYPVVESTTAPHGYHAYAEWPPKHYTVQTAWFATTYPEPYNRIYLACTLAHEGAHLWYNTSREEIPLMEQYICLDRAGAPQEAKDFIYGLLKDSIVPHATTAGGPSDNGSSE